jgi:hypothetical protein
MSAVAIATRLVNGPRDACRVSATASCGHGIRQPVAPSSIAATKSAVICSNRSFADISTDSSFAALVSSLRDATATNSRAT